MNVLDQAAARAASSAMDAATARPLNVVISLDDVTRQWLTVIAVGLGAVILMKGKK